MLAMLNHAARQRLMADALASLCPEDAPGAQLCAEARAHDFAPNTRAAKHYRACTDLFSCIQAFARSASEPRPPSHPRYVWRPIVTPCDPRTE